MCHCKASLNSFKEWELPWISLRDTSVVIQIRSCLQCRNWWHREILSQTLSNPLLTLDIVILVLPDYVRENRYMLAVRISHLNLAYLDCTQSLLFVLFQWKGYPLPDKILISMSTDYNLSVLLVVTRLNYPCSGSLLSQSFIYPGCLFPGPPHDTQFAVLHSRLLSKNSEI